MTDAMKEIKGYFRIQKIANNKVIYEYEDRNTIMIRVPELFAGQTSGMYKKDVPQYTINTIALGTNGYNEEDKTTKTVPRTRYQMFSELDFWNTRLDAEAGKPVLPEIKKYVYQCTWEVEPIGDFGKNTSYKQRVDVQNEGGTYPVWEHGDTHLPSSNHIGYPIEYRGPKRSQDDDGMRGKVAQYQNVVDYEFTLGQFAGNGPTGLSRFNEAALYMKYLDFTNDKDPQNGNPLGQLFSMKTFPTVYKDSSCAIRITWRLYF